LLCETNQRPPFIRWPFHRVLLVQGFMERILAEKLKQVWLTYQAFYNPLGIVISLVDITPWLSKEYKMKQINEVASFTEQMVMACESAMTLDIIYHDQFKKIVLEKMGGYGCNAELFGIFSIDHGSDDYLKTYQKMISDAENHVKRLPRGHYAIIERVASTSSYSMIVSDGTGKISVGGKFNSYTTMPTATDVLDCMLSYEIYQCRKAIEMRNARVLNENVMRTHHFYVGQVFKDLQTDEHLPKHKFATTTVSEITDDLQIKLSSTVRGSKFIWSGFVSPTLLSKMIGWVKPKRLNKTSESSTQPALF